MFSTTPTRKPYLKPYRIPCPSGLCFPASDRATFSFYHYDPKTGGHVRGFNDSSDDFVRASGLRGDADITREDYEVLRKLLGYDKTYLAVVNRASRWMSLKGSRFPSAGLDFERIDFEEPKCQCRFAARPRAPVTEPEYPMDF